MPDFIFATRSRFAPSALIRRSMIAGAIVIRYAAVAASRSRREREAFEPTGWHEVRERRGVPWTAQQNRNSSITGSPRTWPGPPGPYGLQYQRLPQRLAGVVAVLSGHCTQLIQNLLLHARSGCAYRLTMTFMTVLRSLIESSKAHNPDAQSRSRRHLATRLLPDDPSNTTNRASWVS